MYSLSHTNRRSILHIRESQIRVEAAIGTLTHGLKIHQDKGDIIHPNQPISTQLPCFEQRKYILYNPNPKHHLDRLLRHNQSAGVYQADSDRHTPSSARKQQQQICGFQATFAHMNRCFAISDRTRPDRDRFPQ